MNAAAKLSSAQSADLIRILENRFHKHMNRHQGLKWTDVTDRLAKQPAKLHTLSVMESTGGEPDVIGYDKKTKEFIFCDCSEQSPSGRRSACYDREALDARKEHKPKNNVIEWATEMGITLLDEDHYRQLQELGPFDTKTSSWIVTPQPVRKLGGALFADFRYGRVFVYHNGAESYYAARGFRGMLRV